MNDRAINVGIVSSDPFFLFAARSLLGRDRRTRTFGDAPTLDALRQAMAGTILTIDVVVCDLDSFDGDPAFFADLRQMAASVPGTRLICLAQAHLDHVASELENTPLAALLTKQELGYCLHLAVQGVAANHATLLTPNIRRRLARGSTLERAGRTIRPEQKYPDLTARIEEVVMWRFFLGLDNPDIEDELILGDDTIRKYVSKAYKALGASNEIEAFEALSDWWWVTRFAPALDEG
jgi:DNA-binding NarL/FixJ family response regulator